MCKGYSYFESEPFETEAAARAAWKAHKSEIMALRDATHESRPPEGACFKSGTRPWGFWKFEQREDPPGAQFGLLEELGELLPGEREKALALAKEEWLGYPPGSTKRGPVSDEDLLDAWPYFPCEDVADEDLLEN